MLARHTLVAGLVLTATLGTSFTTRADDAPASDVSKDVAGWIAGLESDSFAERQSATNELLKAGKPAAAALAKAAEESFDLEVPTRCVNILGKMLRGGDAEAKAAAEKALETLSTSDRKFLARRAKETLKGPEEAPVQGVPGLGGIAGNIQIQGIAGGNNVRISTRTVNGQRQTKVDADGKQIEITDTNGKDIAMKVTETVAGNKVTKEYAADDLADLKKKHPEAAKLYEQYSGNAAGIRVLQNRIRLRAGAPGVAPAAIRPFRMPFVPRQQVESAIEKLEKSLAELEQLEKDGKVPAGTLDDVRKRLAEAKGDLQNMP